MSSDKRPWHCDSHFTLNKMSAKARHVQSLFCWVLPISWWRLLILIMRYVGTVSSLSVHVCHYHTLSLLFMYLFPCLHQRIWSSCIVCILRLHMVCKECKTTWKRSMLLSAVFRTSASRRSLFGSSWLIRSRIYSSSLACSSGALVTNGRRHQNKWTISVTLQGNSCLFMAILYPQMCH